MKLQCYRKIGRVKIENLKQPWLFSRPSFSFSWDVHAHPCICWLAVGTVGSSLGDLLNLTRFSTVKTRTWLPGCRLVVGV